MQKADPPHSLHCAFILPWGHFLDPLPFRGMVALLEAGSSALCCCKGVSQLSHSLPALLAITPPRLCSASSPNIPRRPSSSQSAWLENLGSDSPPHTLHCALNFPWEQKADPPHSLHCALNFPWGQCLGFFIRDSPPACRGRPCSSKSSCLPGKPVPITPDSGTLVVMIKHMECAHPRRT